MKIIECEIINIRKFKSQNKDMYDLEVEDNHNFFANGILTHNSATAFRDDGNDMMMHATGGPIVFSLTGQELIEQGYLMKPEIVFLKQNIPSDDMAKMENAAEQGLINETPKYGPYYQKLIVENEYRNNHIKKICEQHNGKTILILVKLIEHGKALEELIPDSLYIYGETASLIRTKALSDFKEGKLKTLISTISIFAEGVDIPRLDVVVNAAANKGDIKSIQVLGRVLRRKEGKEKAMYYDFADTGKFFYTASRARAEAFKGEGHTVRYEEIE